MQAAATGTGGPGLLQKLGRVLKEKAAGDLQRIFKGTEKTRAKLGVRAPLHTASRLLCCYRRWPCQFTSTVARRGTEARSEVSKLTIAALLLLYWAVQHSCPQSFCSGATSGPALVAKDTCCGGRAGAGGVHQHAWPE